MFTWEITRLPVINGRFLNNAWFSFPCLNYKCLRVKLCAVLCLQRSKYQVLPQSKCYCHVIGLEQLCSLEGIRGSVFTWKFRLGNSTGGPPAWPSSVSQARATCSAAQLALRPGSRPTPPSLLPPQLCSPSSQLGSGCAPTAPPLPNIGERRALHELQRGRREGAVHSCLWCSK